MLIRASPTTLLSIFFAALGLIYLLLGLHAKAGNTAGFNPARRGRLRISLIFFAVAAFLIYRSRSPG